MSFRAWDDCDKGRDSEVWPVMFTYKPGKQGE
jgi:hypothetical protein